jgi:hypothetical protein
VIYSSDAVQADKACGEGLACPALQQHNAFCVMCHHQCDVWMYTGLAKVHVTVASIIGLSTKTRSGL